MALVTRALEVGRTIREASPTFGRALVDLGRAVLDLVYPPTCLACDTATATPHGLCPSCWASFRFIERPFCERLGTPFVFDIGGELLSPAAIADPPVFRRARAVARYEDAGRRLVHRFKFSDRLDLAPAMAAWMVRAGTELLAETDVIVPVPLHRGRLWSRRFNQASVLAKLIAAKAQRPFEPLALIRVKPTESQVGLTRDQRRNNLAGAFRVAPEKRILVEGRRILLIDDVLTTGATANAASRALLRAGAVSVDVLTFAIVVLDGLDSQTFADA